MLPFIIIPLLYSRLLKHSHIAAMTMQTKVRAESQKVVPSLLVAKYLAYPNWKAGANTG